MAAVVVLMAGCSGRSAREPAEREVDIFFLREAVCEVVPVTRTVSGVTSLDFARAALEQLVAGPTEDEAANGYRSRLPDRDAIWRYRQSRLAFQQKSPYAGDELQILEVRELDARLLYVNFSPELIAYGRGEDRVCEVTRQIQATVQQFDEYQDVSIAVGGQHRGVLQP